MHKQKLFYTPIWQGQLPFDKGEILPHVELYEKHRFDEDIPEDTFYFDGSKKGFTTRLLTLADEYDESKQAYGPADTVVYHPTIHMLCDMITDYVKTVESDLELIDFQIYRIGKGNYQRLVNNDADTKYTAHYTLQVDDVHDMGEYRFINPNTMAQPLYQSMPVRENQLIVWPSYMMYEMLTYQGETDRISLLLNYGVK
jgi:hypothetical protein